MHAVANNNRPCLEQGRRPGLNELVLWPPDAYLCVYIYTRHGISSSEKGKEPAIHLGDGTRGNYPGGNCRLKGWLNIIVLALCLDRVSLSGWPGTHRDSLPIASQVLEIIICKIKNSDHSVNCENRTQTMAKNNDEVGKTHWQNRVLEKKERFCKIHPCIRGLLGAHSLPGEQYQKTREWHRHQSSGHIMPQNGGPNWHGFPEPCL